MKTALKLILLLTLSLSCFSQNVRKENLNLVFYDDSSNQIIVPEFDILQEQYLNDSFITVYKKIDDWLLQFSTILKTKNDTIRIPKILFASGNELHSKRWTYLNCGKVCNGVETDFYENGNKRTEGTYKNGKPIEIKEYRENGILKAQYFYKNLTLLYKRIDYYDENGKLEEYEIHKNKKRKTTIKTFNENNELINRKIERHFIE